MKTKIKSRESKQIEIKNKFPIRARNRIIVFVVIYTILFFSALIAFIDTFRTNPLPSILIGIAIYLFILTSLRGSFGGGNKNIRIDEVENLFKVGNKEVPLNKLKVNVNFLKYKNPLRKGFWNGDIVEINFNNSNNKNIYSTRMLPATFNKFRKTIAKIERFKDN